MKKLCGECGKRPARGSRRGGGRKGANHRYAQRPGHDLCNQCFKSLMAKAFNRRLQDHQIEFGHAPGYQRCGTCLRLEEEAKGA